MLNLLCSLVSLSDINELANKKLARVSQYTVGTKICCIFRLNNCLGHKSPSNKGKGNIKGRVSIVRLTCAKALLLSQICLEFDCNSMYTYFREYLMLIIGSGYDIGWYLLNAFV